jgi:hypothetical protein
MKAAHALTPPRPPLVIRTSSSCEHWLRSPTGEMVQVSPFDLFVANNWSAAHGAALLRLREREALTIRVGGVSYLYTRLRPQLAVRNVGTIDLDMPPASGRRPT